MNIPSKQDVVTTVHPINLNLPPALYQRLVEVADASQQSLAEVIIQSLHTGLPPSLDHIPDRFQADLKALNQFDDRLLQVAAKQDLSVDKATLYKDLLLKNQIDNLNTEEQAQLDTLRDEADLLMFRRAYATALLKWRGQPAPDLKV